MHYAWAWKAFKEQILNQLSSYKKTQQYWQRPDYFLIKLFISWWDPHMELQKLEQLENCLYLASTCVFMNLMRLKLYLFLGPLHP